jgi:cellulose synthase (UDP-forming)
LLSGNLHFAPSRADVPQVIPDNRPSPAPQLPAQRRPAPEQEPRPWPAWPESGLPTTESPRRRSAVRLLALGAIVCTLAYLTWRTGWTLSGATLALALPLLLLELHAALSLGLYTHDLWDVDASPARPAGPAPDTNNLRVAVLIPTYNEPAEVLLPTVAAAVALEPAHETWVLDDGDRDWVAALARDLGAHYRRRETHGHAKAGNINAALPELERAGVDLIAVLDADHVASAAFLTDTIGYFSDPDVALVQTPQDFYNLDSFEHVDRHEHGRFGEQDLFYRGLAAGRNAWNAAFWCGTNAVLRLSALLSVGGIATETVTEDIHTTIRLHRHGWRSVYHNAVLARGLAAGTAQQYLGQRLRWGTGAMQVLRSENPITVAGLTVHQRLSYASTLLGWFDSWRSLGYILLPLLTVALGWIPIAAPATVFVPVFLGSFLLQRWALAALGRGRAPWWQSTLFEIIRMPANLLATTAILRRRPAEFRVTHKGRSAEGDRRRGQAPALLVSLTAGTALALVWYAATVLGRTPVGYPIPWVAHGAAIWAVVNGALLVAAIRRIRLDRFSEERRASVRFAVQGGVTVDGVLGQVEDISLTGMRVRAPHARVDGEWQPGRPVAVALPTVGGQLRLTALVRTVQREHASRVAASAVLGIEFATVTAQARASLALALFRSGVAPELVPAPAPVERSDRRPLLDAPRAGVAGLGGQQVEERDGVERLRAEDAGALPRP